MKLVVDQAVAAPPSEVQRAFLDPAFYESLGQLEGISSPQVRSLSSDGAHARLVLAYRFSGPLEGPARRILDPAKLTWTQSAEVDLAALRTEVTMVPDNYRGLLSFSAWYELREAAGGTCTQHMEADLRVHLPLLGPLAERALATGTRQNLAGTARLVERFLSPAPATPPGTTEAG